MATSKTGGKAHNNWGTPPLFFDEYDELYDFNFDPCPLNHDISKWDGLKVEWGTRTFVNPPYDRKTKEAFVKKAVLESKKGKLVVMLLPVSTSTKLFHDYILPNISQPIRFVKGRLKFGNSNSSGTFDSMVVIF